MLRNCQCGSKTLTNRARRTVNHLFVGRAPICCTFSHLLCRIWDQCHCLLHRNCCRFKLQEVRTDPRSHAYLQQPSLEAWQSCSYNTAAPSTGLACLQRVASQLAGSTSAQAVHVIVAGSREEAGYCNAQDVGMGSVCGSVASGHSSARGPWTGAVSSGWREDAVPDNYVFLSW